MNAGRAQRILGVAVAVILVAEMGARLLAPYLPAPELYADQSTAVKAAQLDRLAETDRCATVIVAGNSMARDDLVPAQIASANEDVAVYNAALDAASPELLSRWIPDHVLTRADPDLVVLGLSSFDLNDEARISQSALESFRSAALTRDDSFGRWQQPLLRHLALFRHRRQLRDPVAVWSALSRALRGERETRPDPKGIPGVLGDDGAGLSRRDLTFASAPGSDALLRRELLNDFSIGGAQTDALRSLVDELEGDGVEVALTVLPVTDAYIAAHPDGTADYERFLAVVDDVASSEGVAVLDLHDWADPADFADTHHLAGPAADRLSAALPELLAGAGVALPSC